MKPVNYLSEARALSAQLGESRERLVILATFNSELSHPFLAVETARAGTPLLPESGPFGQVEQIVLQPGNPLWTKGKVGAVLIAMRLADVLPGLVADTVRLGPAGIEAAVRSVRERAVAAAEKVRTFSSATILVGNLCWDRPGRDFFDAGDPAGVGHAIQQENRRLAESLRSIPDAHVIDYDGLVADVGRSRFHDEKLWGMAKAIGGAEAQSAFAKTVARAVRAVRRAPQKCIVVDLDNTLWGGVIGDDGMEGIKLGDDAPGVFFKNLQRALLGYRDRGFLLAVSSKNDREAALEAIRSHPEMLLRPEHFSAMAINWDPKPVGLKSIAHELNIGVDSLVFLDDNPVERAAVRAALPAVDVVELPVDPAQYVASLAAVPGLDRPRLLAEDRKRAEMMAQHQARVAVQGTAGSVEDFLRDLQMEAHVGLAGPADLERVHQLIQKTNQFNLTTRRHDIATVRRLASSPDARVAWLRLSDRFGDLGLVCVGIVQAVEGGTWEIDTFLMSCRVMGRSVERAFLSYLVELAASGGAAKVVGRYLPTAKNGIVRSFFPDHGFELEEEAATGLQFAYPPEKTSLTWPDVVERREGTK